MAQFPRNLSTEKKGMTVWPFGNSSLSARQTTTHEWPSWSLSNRTSNWKTQPTRTFRRQKKLLYLDLALKVKKSSNFMYVLVQVLKGWFWLWFFLAWSHPRWLGHSRISAGHLAVVTRKDHHFQDNMWGFKSQIPSMKIGSVKVLLSNIFRLQPNYERWASNKRFALPLFAPPHMNSLNAQNAYTLQLALRALCRQFIRQQETSPLQMFEFVEFLRVSSCVAPSPDRLLVLFICKSVCSRCTFPKQVVRRILEKSRAKERFQRLEWQSCSASAGFAKCLASGPNQSTKWFDVIWIMLGSLQCVIDHHYCNTSSLQSSAEMTSSKIKTNSCGLLYCW